MKEVCQLLGSLTRPRTSSTSPSVHHAIDPPSAAARALRVSSPHQVIWQGIFQHCRDLGGVGGLEGVDLGPLVGRLAAQLLLGHGVLVYDALLDADPWPTKHSAFALCGVSLACPRPWQGIVTTLGCSSDAVGGRQPRIAGEIAAVARRTSPWWDFTSELRSFPEPLPPHFPRPTLPHPRSFSHVSLAPRTNQASCYAAGVNSAVHRRAESRRPRPKIFSAE